MEIVQERLEREYNLDLITTAPTVRFRCVLRDGDVIELDNPAKFPSEGEIDRIEEPIIAVTIHTPPEYVGGILKLCEEKRGTQTGLTYAGEKRVIIRYDLPLTEMVFGFYDRLKSVSRGYASLDYEPKDYRAGRPRPHGSDGQRRSRRLAVAHRPPRGVLQQGPRPVRQDEGAHPSAAVRGRDPGGHRLARSSRARR